MALPESCLLHLLSCRAAVKCMPRARHTHPAICGTHCAAWQGCNSHCLCPGDAAHKATHPPTHQRARWGKLPDFFSLSHCSVAAGRRGRQRNAARSPMPMVVVMRAQQHHKRSSVIRWRAAALDGYCSSGSRPQHAPPPAQHGIQPAERRSRRPTPQCCVPPALSLRSLSNCEHAAPRAPNSPCPWLSPPPHCHPTPPTTSLLSTPQRMFPLSHPITSTPQRGLPPPSPR